jgi:hypothetical protein
MNKTIFIAAMLTAATVLAAGLAVFPGSVQEAQANPCANEVSRGGNTGGSFNPQGDDDRECDFTGYFEFDENDD